MQGTPEPFELAGIHDPATVEAPRVRHWNGRWYLWDGGFLTMGRGAGVVPPHTHHAIQVTVGLTGDVGMCEGDAGEWRVEGGLIVAPNVPHQLDARGGEIAVLLVDPETREGRWLRRSLTGAFTSIGPERLEALRQLLRSIRDSTADEVETARMILAAVHGLCAGPPPPRALDDRIVRALEVIREMDTARIAQEAVAKAVFLSPSRFAHLFSEQVGLPFRRYVLWRRLTRAMLAVGRGATLSAAAHQSGFADSAHLTRTCYQMFGQPPSVMLGTSEFYELPAPFELPHRA